MLLGRITEGYKCSKALLANVIYDSWHYLGLFNHNCNRRLYDHEKSSSYSNMNLRKINTTRGYCCSTFESLPTFIWIQSNNSFHSSFNHINQSKLN